MALSMFSTTTASGSFNVQSDGFVQGTMLDDPVGYQKLAGGFVASTETLPMWGGIAIGEDIPLTTVMSAVGPSLVRATVVAGITGFTCLNQLHSAITWPQSPSPLAYAGSSMHFLRLGSGARLAVRCEPSLASIAGGLINQQVSWDFNNQLLQPYDASTATYSVTSITWAATNGGQGVVVAPSATPVAGVGDVVYISGATNTGTGGATAVNGSFTVTAFTDNEHFIIGMPAGTGVIATIAGTILLNYGIGALSVKVLDFNIGNSMTVNYDAVNGVATWNRAGSTAIILL